MNAKHQTLRLDDTTAQMLQQLIEKYGASTNETICRTIRLGAITLHHPPGSKLSRHARRHAITLLTYAGNARRLRTHASL